MFNSDIMFQLWLITSDSLHRDVCPSPSILLFLRMQHTIKVDGRNSVLQSSTYCVPASRMLVKKEGSGLLASLSW